MQDRRLFALLGLFLAILFGLSGQCALASGTPSFTISATNATMPTNGSGSIPFTLTSVNGYSGTVVVHCADYNPPAEAKLTYCCGSVAPMVYTLTANQVLNESMALLASPTPCSNPCPVNMKPLPRPGHGGSASLALAGVLLVGLGFRQRKARWFTLALFTVGTLAGINACGSISSSNTLTPGTYPYTFMASDANTNESVTTTVNVTVPSGVTTTQ
jgi:hypothetical protein